MVQLDPEEVLEVFGDRDPTEMHAALARTYLDDERFTAHDGRAPGLAQYVHDAVLAAAAR
ncbi:MAG: TipAS antibiotic-recognition domain [Frankiales bacterium]|nr:TipAS antibiotic-recognition domain [Frankiales bacterium]